ECHLARRVDLPEVATGRDRGDGAGVFRPMSGGIIFAIFGGLAVLTSLLVVAQRNPTHSALFLVLSFLNVACIYVLLNAEFVAVVQVIVYTGAVLVLFLFAIILVRMEYLPEMYGGHPVQRFVG